MKLDLYNIELSKYDIERNVKLPNKIDENLAYFCGVLAGDGYISNRRWDYDVICRGNPKDEIEFYDIILKNLIKELFNFNSDILSALKCGASRERI